MDHSTDALLHEKHTDIVVIMEFINTDLQKLHEHSSAEKQLRGQNSRIIVQGQYNNSKGVWYAQAGNYYL